MKTWMRLRCAPLAIAIGLAVSAGRADAAWIRQSLPGGIVPAMAAAAGGGAPVFALVDRGGGEVALYRETDSRWTGLAGPPELATAGWGAKGIDVPRGRPERVLAFGSHFLARSTDGGAGFGSVFPPAAESGGLVTAAWSSDGERILAATGEAGATAARVLRSTDSGRTWAAGEIALRGAVRTIAADSADPLGFWLVDAGGLLRSDDGGETARRVLELEWPTAFTAAGADLAIASAAGVIRSSDGGATFGWPQLEGRFIAELDLDPLAPGRLFVRTEDDVLRSDFPGAPFLSIRPERDGFPHSMLALEGRLLVGLRPDGVLESRDSGEAWTLSADGLSERAAERLVAGGGRRIALSSGALFVDTSPRSGWLEVGEALPAVRDALVLPGGALLALSAEKLHRSDDGGRSWSDVATFSGESLRFVRHDAVAGRTYVAGSRLFGSGDGGVTFWAAAPFPWEASTLTDLLAGGEPERVIAAFRTDKYGSTGGLEHSVDSGRTWRHVARPWGGTTSLVFEPAAPNRIFGIQAFWFYGSGSVVRSLDGGRSFAPVEVARPACTECYPLPSAIAAHPRIAGRIVVGFGGLRLGPGPATFGAFESPDDGATWRDLSGEPMTRHQVRSILYDPVDPRRIWAATEGGIFVREPGPRQAEPGDPRVSLR